MRTMIAQMGLALVALAMVGTAHAQEPTRPENGMSQAAACAPEGSGFTCSRIGFRRVWHRAQTVRIETNPMDKGARTQVEEYLAAAGKTVAADNTVADLLFVLKPVDGNGVRIGPSGSDLSVLSVYLITDGKRGPLVWSQTYNGQADMRWPAVVHASIEQFKSEFDRRKK